MTGAQCSGDEVEVGGCALVGRWCPKIMIFYLPSLKLGSLKLRKFSHINKWTTTTKNY